MKAHRTGPLVSSRIRIDRLRLLRAAMLTAVAFAACGVLGATSATADSEAPAFTPVAGSPFPAGTEATSVAFSPNGGLLAAANYTSSNVYVYSVSSAGELTDVPGAPFSAGFPVTATFSPVGGLLAVDNTSPGTIGMFTVEADGALSPVTGSPFATSGHPFGIAFSPDGTLLATANLTGSVSVFSVAADGTLTEVSGSPFAAGSEAESVAFSPNGATLAVANRRSETVSVYSVAASGQLTPVPGSPFATAAIPTKLAYSPDGALLAVSDFGANEVSMFSVAPNGSLTPAAGSPFDAGEEPLGLAFGSGDLLAVTNPNVNEISVFSIAPDGRATPVAGSPYTDSGYPYSVAFSPNGASLAVSNVSSNDVWMLSRAVPNARIDSPAAGQSYSLGERVPTSFSCSDPTGPAGLESCTDSNGGSGSTGFLSTSSAGSHSYTVTATGSSGLTASASISYTVSPEATVTATTPQTKPPQAPLAAASPPSNRLVILARKHRRSGTIELRVRVPGRGSLQLLGSHVAPIDWACRVGGSQSSSAARRLAWGRTDTTIEGAETLSVTLSPTKAARMLFARHRRHGWPLNVLVSAIYDPTGGTPHSISFLVPVLSRNSTTKAMCTG